MLYGDQFDHIAGQRAAAENDEKVRYIIRQKHKFRTSIPLKVFWKE